MKKILVILGVLFFTSALLKAQSDQKLHFGLKAAPSLAWISSDTKGFASNGSKLGFSYGLITEFKFADHYAFATGIDVAYRGGSSKFSTTDTTAAIVTETSYSLQYIELPLTLKLKTNEIGYLTYFLQFGFSPGLNIRSKADVKTTVQIGTNPSTATEETDVDIKEGINNMSVSMIIGGGVEYTLSGSTVLLGGITFNNGFMDIINGDQIKANSNYLALTFGVLF
ncbi:MAG: porin family protein [Bacteroidetes bacterium]|nr:porin family protein [Bacteroidota bacterium]